MCAEQREEGVWREGEERKTGSDPLIEGCTLACNKPLALPDLNCQPPTQRAPCLDVLAAAVHVLRGVRACVWLVDQGEPVGKERKGKYSKHSSWRPPLSAAAIRCMHPANSIREGTTILSWVRISTHLLICTALITHGMQADASKHATPYFLVVPRLH